jgi:hypothetical protein
MERTAQYREQPVHASTARHDAPRRYRRVLVGTAAAATLCVTALAGSFIGGTSSGKVDVAEAAWSAIPATPTAEQVKKVQLDCNITSETLGKGEGVPPASIPDYMLGLPWLTCAAQQRRPCISHGLQPSCVCSSVMGALMRQKLL